ncbi:MAG: hypothetical protein WC868_04530 [Bacteroidales bacterium]
MKKNKIASEWLKQKQKSNKLAEPEVGYYPAPNKVNSQTNISISTLKGQEEANYIYWLSLTPEKRFELHYKMITHFFSDELKKNRSDNNTISFSE